MEKTKKNQFRYIIFFAFLILIFFANTYKVLGAENKKNHILIIQSYDAQHSWENLLLDGINDTFKNKLKNYTVDVEYMHMKKYFGDEYLEKMAEFYKYKYDSKRYDVIIVCDHYAFDFMRRYNDKIFKNTPVVFCGVNAFDKSLLKENENFAGIFEESNIKETIDIALKQNKDSKEINVFLNMTPTGFSYKKTIEGILENYKDKYKINIIQVSNISEAKKWVHTLSEKSIILLVADSKDDNDEYMSYSEVGKILSSETNIPMYGLWDFVLGNGIVGGSVIRAKEHGKLVADMAVSIINGEKINNIGVKLDSNSQYMFDYNVVKKFKIPRYLIPANSKMINKPVRTVCYIDKMLVIIATVGVIVILSIVVIILTINIARRKKVEDDLKASEYQLRTIIDSSPNIICFKDKDGRWLKANEATLKAFKIEDIDYRGKTSKELAEIIKKSNSSLYNCEKSDLEAWKTEKVYISEEVLKEDNDKVYEFIKIPVFHEGEKRALIVIAREITEEKLNQHLMEEVEKNQRLLDETIEYDKIKTEFFANISHELKTPLNVIFSTVQLFDLYLRSSQIVENGVDMGRNIYVLKQNCFRLLRLVNNLIDITKLDSGYFSLNLKNRDIINVIEDITLSVAEFIERKDIELVFDTELEEKLMAFDEDKIERIMLNLLSNAVKFTPKGGEINVNVYDKNDKITIHVKDTGIGIPKDKQKIIFDRFRQVDKSLTRNREGSGIGLSLVKSLVELHNGKLHLESEEGKGSEFIIELPVVLVEEKEEYMDDKTIKQSYVERISIEFSDIYS